MKTNAYQPYKDLLEQIVNSGQIKKSYSDSILEKGLGGEIGTFGGHRETRTFTRLDEHEASGIQNRLRVQLRSQDANEVLYESLETALGRPVNRTKQDHLRPGNHPTFQALRHSPAATFNRNVVSVFIDIKGSTNLHKKYENTTILNITNLVQTASTHTAWCFNGYVQRFHGDGLFVYFGAREGETIQDGVRNALDACACISQFFKHDVKNLFFEEGVENLTIRIGIDVGRKDSDVLWYLAGANECSEITTLSLHTSLAPKMQAYAKSNGIVVGDNVKNFATLGSDLFDYVRNSNGEIERRYIYEIPDEHFRYTQWDFKWEKHLQNQYEANQNKTSSGPTIITSKPTIDVDYLREEASKVRPYWG